MFIFSPPTSCAPRGVVASTLFNTRSRNWTKCLKKQPSDVIKMMEMRGEVVKKKLLKKRWIITHFYDVTWLIVQLPKSNSILMLLI